MKTLLFSSWIMFGCAGYYGYTFYQQTILDKAAANHALADAQASNDQLKEQVDNFGSQLKQSTDQLEQERKISSDLREAALVAASSAPAPAPVASKLQQAPTPENFPSTITTLDGKTYQGCKLDRAFPDGIAFFHDRGIAKVPFTDLDPAFAASFGYNEADAQKYEQEQAIREQQSDAIRAEFVREQNAKEAAIGHASATTQQPAAQKTLSDFQRQAIQNQINALESDIAFMQAQEAKILPNTNIVMSDGNKTSQGVYPTKIAQEQAQVDQLRAELQ